jgi:type I restriction enzyme S subunit
VKAVPTKLGAICSFRTGKLDSNAAVPDGGYPFFTCAQETLRIDKAAFDTEAVLLGGNNAAGVYPLKYYNGEFNAYQRTYVIESLDDNVLSIRYLYYVLQQALAHFQSVSIGASTQYLTKPVLDGFTVQLPSRATQDAIVSILSVYDDLIENNRRRMALLEEAARLLYQEWFVSLRFPGHERVQVIDGVPEGWEREPLGLHVSFERGIEPGAVNYQSESGPGLVRFLRVGDLGDRPASVFIDSDLAGDRILKPSDIAITLDGTIGLVRLGLDGAFSSGIRRLVPKRECTVGWALLFETLQSDHIQDTIRAYAKGVTIQHASAAIDAMTFVRPTRTLLNCFEDQAAPMLRAWLLLRKMNAALGSARDLLLPRLMSGESELSVPQRR